jgi:hypothetical protein
MMHEDKGLLKRYAIAVVVSWITLAVGAITIAILVRRLWI